MKAAYRYIRILFLRLLGFIYGRQLETFKNVVILAPHPDDEIFGCNALIQHQIEEAHGVSVIFLTDGEGSHRNCCSTNPIEIASNRQMLAKRANVSITKNIHFLHFPDGGIGVEETSTKEVKKIVKALNPDAIFTPHHFEGWHDHTNTNKIGSIIAKELNISLYEYCVWFWISMSFSKAFKCRWRNSRFLIPDQAKKRRAIDIYTQALAPCGKPWSGQLRKQFIKANCWERELYFKAN